MIQKFEIRLALTTLLLGISATASAETRSQATSASVEETLLGETSFIGTLDSDSFDTASEDGQWVAWRGKAPNDLWAVMVNGEQQGGSYEKVEEPRFLSGGARFAFKASQGKKWLYVLDGKQSEAYDDVRYLYLSRDGRRQAYAATAAGKWAMVIDGESSMRVLGENKIQGIAYDEVGPARFSPDGKSVAYRVRKDKKESLIFDGSAGPAYDEIGDPFFPGEDQAPVYPAKRKKKWVVVAGGKELGPEMDDIWRGTMMLNGQVLMSGLPFTITRSAGFVYAGWMRGTLAPVVVAGGEARPAADTGLRHHAIAWPVFFGEEGRRFAYAAAEVRYGFGGGAKGFGQVIVDAVPGPVFEGQSTKSLGRFFLEAAAGYVSQKGLVEGVAPFSARWYGVSRPEVSPDGEHVAYGARRGEVDFVVIADGQPGPSFEDIQCGPLYTARGTLVYVGEEKESLVLVRNQERAAEFRWKDADCDDILIAGEDHVVFSARGNAPGDGEKKMRVFVDGEPGPELDAARVKLAARVHEKKLRVAYGVVGMREEEGYYYVVVDGREGSRYDWVAALRIEDDGSVGYVARKGRRFFRLQHRAPASP